MGDMGEVFNDMRKAKQERRAANTKDSTAMLAGHGIDFESHNSGAHLIVHAGVCKIDFWPSTGLWIVRGSKKRHGGVRKLIEYVQKQRKM